MHPSIIMHDVAIAGDLDSAGDLLIHGTVTGDIRSRSVTIGEAARIEGSLTAETVDIRGSVYGPVTAVKVTIAATAKVIGSITHNTISIEPGAQLDGLRPWLPPNKVRKEA